MLLPEGGLSCVGSFGILPAVADVVRRDRTIIVEVRLVIGDHHGIGNVPEPGRTAHVLGELVEIALQQSEARTVISLRTGKGEPVGRIVGKNETEVIGLHLLIPRTGSGQGSQVNLGKKMMMLVVSGERP
jgi:hypothetical protein